MRERPDNLDYRPRIKEMPSDERPRERLLRYGASSLSNAELIAIVLRSGMAGKNVLELASSLLAQFKGLAGLAKASEVELGNIKGMGEAKTAQLKAALELGKRLGVLSPEERPQIRSPEDALALVMADMALLEQEHLRVILLDTKHRVEHVHTVYVGRLDGVNIRMADLFREAARRNAAALIAVHNHPSGDPAPSTEDVKITEQMIQAGQLLEISVLDHIIIGRNRYVSLRERGLAFDGKTMK